MSIRGGSREFYLAVLEAAGWGSFIVQEDFYFPLALIYCAKPRCRFGASPPPRGMEGRDDVYLPAERFIPMIPTPVPVDLPSP